METRTLKDARGSGDCERGPGEEGPFNKCLSRFMGIDVRPSDFSYTGFSTDGTRAFTGDIPRAVPVNTPCKHIEADLGRKYKPACVKCETGKPYSIFRLPQKTCRIFSPRKRSVTYEDFTLNVTNSRVGENHYSKWPVPEKDNIWIKGEAGGNQLYCDSHETEYKGVLDSVISTRVSTHSCCDDAKKFICQKPFSVTSNPCIVHSADSYYACPEKHSNEYAELDYDAQTKQISEGNGNNIWAKEHVSTVVYSERQRARPSRPASTIAIDGDQSLSDTPSGVLESKSHPSSSLASRHGISASITVLQVARSSSDLASFSSIPGPALDMKPAKIGQLTPIVNRSPAIDGSDPHGAGVQVIPTAQQAWLCGGNDVLGACDGKGDSGCGRGDFVTAGTKHNVDVTGGTGSTTEVKALALATGKGATTFGKFPFPPESEAAGGDGGDSSQCSRGGVDREQTIDIQLPDIRLLNNDAENVNIDSTIQTKPRCFARDVVNTSRGRSFVEAKSGGQKVAHLPLQQVKQSVIAGARNYQSQSPLNGSTALSLHSETSHEGNDAHFPVSGEEDYSSCETLTEENILSFGVDGEKQFDGSKTLGQFVAGKQSEFLTDMNKKDVNQSVVYANFLHDSKSISPSEERQQQVCLCNAHKNDQILAVNSKDFHQNRLSHQYLNSSVTGQNYPDFLPDNVHNYQYFFTDTGLVSYPEFDVDSSMIFTATATKETSFTEKTSNSSKPSPSSSPAHHYYNKSSVFSPLVRESCASPSNISIKKNDEKSFKIFLPSNGTNNHGNKREEDLDLMLFPQISQLHCPVHRLSPVLPPQQYLQQQHQQQQQQHHHDLHQNPEQQHLLNHLHSHHHGSHFIRQQQPPATSHGHQLQFQQHQNHHRSSISSGSSLLHHIKCGPHYIRISPVSLLWTFLSVLVAGTCLLSFLTPYWTVHPDHVHSFGLFNLCVRDERFSHPRPVCMNFDHRQYYSTTRPSSSNTDSAAADNNNNNNNDNISAGDIIGTGETSVDIARIPSGAWQAACLLFGAGVCVQILGAIVSLVVLALTEPWHHRIALINGYMQTVGVLLLVSGLMLYPVGFSSPFFSYYCDSSRAFYTGHCSLGWSYITAIMAAALSIFCPVMSSFAEAQQVVRKPIAIVETVTA